MSWTEWFNSGIVAASLMGLMVGSMMGFVAWRISREADHLIQQGHRESQALIERTRANT